MDHEQANEEQFDDRISVLEQMMRLDRETARVCLFWLVAIALLAGLGAACISIFAPGFESGALTALAVSGAVGFALPAALRVWLAKRQSISQASQLREAYQQISGRWTPEPVQVKHIDDRFVELTGGEAR